MKTKHEYVMVRSRGVNEFGTEVSRRLNEGFEVRGEVFMVELVEGNGPGSGMCFCQSMVKYDPKPEWQSVEFTRSAVKDMNEMAGRIRKIFEEFKAF